MSLDYQRQTVSFLGTRSFTVQVEEVALERDGVQVHVTHRHVLSRGARERFAFSCVQYPTGVETYWFEILDFHGLRTHDFQVDSWKHFADRVEIKYYAREDGVGFSFVLSLP